MVNPVFQRARPGVQFVAAAAVCFALGCSHPGPMLPEQGVLRSGSIGPRAPDSTPTAPEYVLQPGDEVNLQVYREPELSGLFRIGPSGEIRHSLAGVIPLAGKTVRAAEGDLTRRLEADYLVNPRVILKVVSSQSGQIVLFGEVMKPGVYPLPFGESMTLLQAIAVAGGFTDLASPDRVRIVRRSRDGQQTTLTVRVSDLLKGKGGQKDIPLEPNDVITVPEVIF